MAKSSHCAWQVFTPASNPEEFSFVEELMIGGFSFPYTKEALAKRKGNSEKKRKKPFPDTSHVDQVSGV